MDERYAGIAGLVDDLRQRGDRPAISDTGSGRRLTAADLADAADAAAGHWAARLGDPGAVVALAGANGAPWLVTALGLDRIGAVTATINPTGAPREIAEQLGRTRASWLAADPDVIERLGDAAPRVRAEPLATVPSDAADPPRVPRTGDDVAALMTSSGTTGRPKTARMTRRALDVSGAQLALAWALGLDDVVLGVLPYSHGAGFSTAFGALGAGAALVTLPRFEPLRFLAALAEHRVTVVMGAPPVLRVLAAHPAVDDHDLGALRVVATAGAPLSPELQAACETRLDVTVCNHYGMTETGWIAGGSVAAPGAPGTVGRLLPEVDMRVVDPETGTVCPPGATGELQVRGPALTPGYLDDPDATAALLTPDGWARTGDLGTCDDDGTVRTVDRLKELIKYKGHQVSPTELEELLVSRDDVIDAAVVGDPDPEAGEVPHAYVVARTAVDPGELLAWVAEQVSPYKRIRSVTFVAEIPRLPAGKIVRRMLGATPVP